MMVTYDGLCNSPTSSVIDQTFPNLVSDTVKSKVLIQLYFSNERYLLQSFCPFDQN